jgi:hypothetical protein
LIHDLASSQRPVCKIETNFIDNAGFCLSSVSTEESSKSEKSADAPSDVFAGFLLALFAMLKSNEYVMNIINIHVNLYFALCIPDLKRNIFIN